MSIRILPDNEIKQKASSFHSPALLFANPKNLYERRANRLRELAKEHSFADYLNFAAEIADAQLTILTANPLEKNEFPINSLNPLDVKTWQRDKKWREYLIALLAEIQPNSNDLIQATIDWLQKASASELETLADKLLNQDYADIPSDKAVFIWAALSLYWLQLAQQIPHNGTRDNADDLQCCPICRSAPVASIVHFGDAQGLRYLHCSLCETEWNLVRAQCTSCNQSGKLDFWSLDDKMALVRAESCGDCQSYLKIMFQDKDPKVEVVADDLATIYLDLEMEKKNFLRSGVNPFMFPAE